MPRSVGLELTQQRLVDSRLDIHVLNRPAAHDKRNVVWYSKEIRLIVARHSVGHFFQPAHSPHLIITRKEVYKCREFVWEWSVALNLREKRIVQVLAASGVAQEALVAAKRGPEFLGIALEPGLRTRVDEPDRRWCRRRYGS